MTTATRLLAYDAFTVRLALFRCVQCRWCPNVERIHGDLARGCIGPVSAERRRSTARSADVRLTGRRGRRRDWTRTCSVRRLTAFEWQGATTSCTATELHHTTVVGLGDSHSGRGSGRGLYANVDQSPLSGRGHVTALDQWGPYDAEAT